MGVGTMTEPETVYVVRGIPSEPDAEQIPVTIHDLRSRRVRYVHAPRAQLAVMAGRDIAKWTAYWIQPHPKDRGEWRLVDVVSELGTEAA